MSACVGNFSPCPSLVTGPAGPRHALANNRWLFWGREQAQTSAVTRNTFLWVYPSDFTAGGMTGIAIPASPGRWALGTRVPAQGRRAPACFTSPGRRLSPLFVRREPCLRVRIPPPPPESGLYSADAVGIYWVLSCKRGLALPKELNAGSVTYALYFRD